MPIQVKLPNLGENIESGDILSIFVKEGDQIAVDQDLVEIETDKATMPVPSPQAGQITKILVSEGSTLAIGMPILELEPVNSPIPEEPAPQPEPVRAPPPSQTPPTQEIPQPSPQPLPPQPLPPQPAVAPSDAPKIPPPAPAFPSNRDTPKPEVDTPGDGHSGAAAGPAVRRLARELGVDLRRVRPMSPGGRITAEDVRSHVRETNEQVEADSKQGVTPPGSPESDGFGAVRREKMSRMRQTIGRNMLQSYTTIPQLTNFDDVDITELERIRQDSKEDYASSGVKLTTMPFLVKAVSTALRLHPIINSSIDEEGLSILYKEYVNIGIAVDTPRGLVVPVLRDADRKSIPQIVHGLTEMANAVRTGDFSIDDLRGGTFTISNLGAIGGTYSTPIINPPEVAILLVGRSRIMPQFIDNNFEPRLMMPLSITYDHRIVDGAAAARFLNEVKGFLANPGRLLLAP